MGFEPGKRTEDGYMAVPVAGGGPGVLVLHAWWGLNAFFMELCDRLAGEGYVALAPDLFGGAVASTVEEAERLRDAHDADASRVEEQVIGALDTLARHPAVTRGRLGVLGCSLGVWWALQTASLRPERVVAAILFYSAGEADFGAARCAYLIHAAANDAFDPPEIVQSMADRMRAAGRQVTLHLYPGAGHWFLETDRPEAYDAEAAALAWERTVTFLNSHLLPDKAA